MDYFSSDNIVKPGKGDLLISEPYLPDPNFERTVVYLCEHDENGTIGFVLNKPSNSVFGELMPEVEGFDQRVYVGGPVQQDSLHFLHRADDQLSGGVEVKNGISWGGDFEELMTMINVGTIRREDYRFFVGYSGWSPGQLEEELQGKSWIVCQDASAQTIFDVEPEELWPHVLKNMGGKFKVIANYPLDPRLN
jgi:putative transcriptional regulator